MESRLLIHFDKLLKIVNGGGYFLDFLLDILLFFHLIR